MWMRRTGGMWLMGLGVALVWIPFPDGLEENVMTGAPAIELGFLPMLMTVLGYLAFTAGVVVLSPLYGVAVKANEIRVGSVGIILFGDVMALLGAGFLMTVSADAAWIKLLNQDTLIGLEPEWIGGTPITGIHFVSVLGTFFAIPFFTFFTTQSFSQRIRIEENGILLRGALGPHFMPWSEVDEVRIEDERSVAQVAANDYRTLRRVLVLESTDDILTLNPPTSRSRKGRLINELENHLPERVLPEFRNAANRW